ncbi:hypothetical protein SAY86_019638 [Trapa natans]|uniref:Uncharacterized protein n=1 Tax=Trapa natans TaxID=22666 RepID=A0AAN7LNH9_TRANT|nr:hypothetical protein SAY86_019638 [Trapa natans]
MWNHTGTAEEKHYRDSFYNHTLSKVGEGGSKAEEEAYNTVQREAVGVVGGGDGGGGGGMEEVEVVVVVDGGVGVDVEKESTPDVEEEDEEGVGGVLAVEGGGGDARGSS